MAQAQPENQMLGDQCTIGKIIDRWVRDKREECMEIVDRNEEVFREKVHKALDELYWAYELDEIVSKDRRGIQGVKYKDPFTQFGHMYKHSIFSARSLSNVMHDCSDAFKNLEKQPSITVACLGGGLGSDAMGVLDYYMKYMGDFKGQLNIRLYDRKDKCEACWESLKTAMDAELDDPRVTVSFHDFDVTVADKNKPDLQNADLITMHYFMEEVFSEKEKKAEAEECFEHIVQTAKPGALFLYSGMFVYQVIDWVYQLLEDKCDLLPPGTEVPTRKYLHWSTKEELPIPKTKVNLHEEEDLKLFHDIRADLETRYPTVEVSPRYHGEVVFRLFQKYRGE